MCVCVFARCKHKTASCGQGEDKMSKHESSPKFGVNAQTDEARSAKLTGSFPGPDPFSALVETHSGGGL